MQLKVEGTALPEVTEKLQQYEQMVSVYEVTSDHDIIAITKFIDTDQMNDQMKSLLTDPDINESNTSADLNSVSKGNQFELEVEEQKIQGAYAASEFCRLKRALVHQYRQTSYRNAYRYSCYLLKSRSE